MRYLIGTDSYINNINRTEGQSRGCNGVTMYWYATRRTNLGATCLLINDDKNIPGSITLEPLWEILSL